MPKPGLEPDWNGWRKHLAGYFPFLYWERRFCSRLSSSKLTLAFAISHSVFTAETENLAQKLIQLPEGQVVCRQDLENSLFVNHSISLFLNWPVKRYGITLDENYGLCETEGRLGQEDPCSVMKLLGWPWANHNQHHLPHRAVVRRGNSVPHPELLGGTAV